MFSSLFILILTVTVWADGLNNASMTSRGRSSDCVSIITKISLHVTEIGPQCSQLEAKLGSRVSYPGSLIYASEQNGNTAGYWSIQEQEVMPTCRVTPATNHDVSIAVQELGRLQCPFAVRGAGHMWWAGAANIEGGVTVDLSAFTNITVSADRKISSAGGGTRWGAIYSKLDTMNLTVVGGRVFDVGIGGLTLGGRYSVVSCSAQREIDMSVQAAIRGSRLAMALFATTSKTFRS